VHEQLLGAGDTSAQSHSAQIRDYAIKLEAAEAQTMKSRDERIALVDEQTVLYEKLDQSEKVSEALQATQNELADTRAQLDDLVRKFVSVEEAMRGERTQWAAERSGVRATLTKSEAAMEALPGVELGEVYALVAEQPGVDERVDELAQSSEQFLHNFEAGMERLDEQVHSYKQSVGQDAAAAVICELQRETATRSMLTLLSRFDASQDDERGGDLTEMMGALEERVVKLAEQSEQRVADMYAQLQAAHTQHRLELDRTEEEMEEQRESMRQQDRVHEASVGKRVAELRAQKDLLDMCDARLAAYSQEYASLVEDVQQADTLQQALDAVAQTSVALGLVQGDESESGAQRVRPANWTRPKPPSDRPAAVVADTAPPTSGEIVRVATSTPTGAGPTKRPFDWEQRAGADVQGGIRFTASAADSPALATRRRSPRLASQQLASQQLGSPAPATLRRSARLAGRQFGSPALAAHRRSARVAGRPLVSYEESRERSSPDAKQRRVLINAD
jgi:hypothetical protein